MDIPGESIQVQPLKDAEYVDSHGTNELNEEFGDETNDYRTAVEPSKGGGNKCSPSARMCSLTWVSDEVKERDAFRRLRLYYLPPSRGHPAKMYPPYLPTNMGEWVAHRVAILEAKAARMKKQIAARLFQRESLCKEKVQPALQGKKLGDFRSTVLAQFTIWRPDEIENPSRAQAPWPDSTECSHEGGERAKSGFGAFPPLPRVPGNPTVNWKQRNTITPYDFDKVGQPMFVNDTPVDVDEHMENLIGNSLCAELNAYGAF